MLKGSITGILTFYRENGVTKLSNRNKIILEHQEREIRQLNS